MFTEALTTIAKLNPTKLEKYKQPKFQSQMKQEVVYFYNGIMLCSDKKDEIMQELHDLNRTGDHAKLSARRKWTTTEWSFYM